MLQTLFSCFHLVPRAVIALLVMGIGAFFLTVGQPMWALLGLICVLRLQFGAFAVAWAG